MPMAKYRYTEYFEMRYCGSVRTCLESGVSEFWKTPSALNHRSITVIDSGALYEELGGPLATSDQ